MQVIQITELTFRVAEALKIAFKEESIRLQYAWWILEALLKKTKSELIAENQIVYTAELKTQINSWIGRIVEHNEPIQYLIGHVPFGPLSIKVEHPILIPRPETEEWVLHFVKQCIDLQLHKKEKIKILEIGTGSGCIALTVGHFLPNATIIAVDINPLALKVAQKNAEKLKIKNVFFVESDLDASVPHDIFFDLILSNPPYISIEEFLELDCSVTAWEDCNALVAEEDGYQMLNKIAHMGLNRLSKDSLFSAVDLPSIILEIGHTQGKLVQEKLNSLGYQSIKIGQDLQKKDRTVSAHL